MDIVGISLVHGDYPNIHCILSAAQCSELTGTGSSLDDHGPRVLSVAVSQLYASCV